MFLCVLLPPWCALPLSKQCDPGYNIFVLPLIRTGKTAHLAACLSCYQSWILEYSARRYEELYQTRGTDCIVTFADLKRWYCQRCLASSTSPLDGFPPLRPNFWMTGRIWEVYKPSKTSLSLSFPSLVKGSFLASAIIKWCSNAITKSKSLEAL